MIEGDCVSTPALPRWLPVLNRLVKILHRLRVPVGPVHTLTVPGRVSGTPRSTPITPITVDGRRFVIAALPQADWARNVRAAGRGDLTDGRRRSTVRLIEVTDPQLCRAVMRAFPSQASGGVPFYVRLGLVTGPDPNEFAAAADRVAVFELHDAT
jgi:deazaflavin-dependent oxidoreductase (nitroreductase family)